MICEICGEYILEGKRVKVEGSVVIACSNCAGCGTVIGDAKYEKKVPVFNTPAKPMKEEFTVETGEELVENYAQIIKNKREKMGLKHKDFARLINEPESVIQRIESGKLEPSPSIAKKFQSKLNVKLLKKSDVLEVKMSPPKDTGPLTLGDVVKVKKKK